MAVVYIPLNPQKTKGYQWKGNVHTFHLIPKCTMCDHWSGHRDALKTGPILYKNFFLQRVDRFPYVKASMGLIVLLVKILNLLHLSRVVQFQFSNTPPLIPIISPFSKANSYSKTLQLQSCCQIILKCTHTACQ